MLRVETRASSAVLGVNLATLLVAGAAAPGIQTVVVRHSDVSAPALVTDDSQ